MDYSQYEAEIFAKLQPLGDPTRIAFIKNYMKSQLGVSGDQGACDAAGCAGEIFIL